MPCMRPLVSSYALLLPAGQARGFESGRYDESLRNPEYQWFACFRGLRGDYTSRVVN